MGYIVYPSDAIFDAGLYYAMTGNGAPVLVPIDEDIEITFAEDNLFVMGDHRNDSNDSRQEGSISRCMIVGHVSAVAWPIPNWRGIPNGLNVPAATEVPEAE